MTTGRGGAGLAVADRLEVEILSRGGGYGQSVARAAPKAIQVADRWRLIENAGRAFRDVARRSLTEMRRARRGPREPPVARLRRTAAGRRPPASAREDRGRQDAGRGPRADRTGRSDGSSCAPVVDGKPCDAFSAVSAKMPSAPARVRSSPGSSDSTKPDPADAATAPRLWRRRRAVGFGGGLPVVAAWAARRRRTETAQTSGPREMPVCPEDRREADAETGPSHSRRGDDRGDPRERCPRPRSRAAPSWAIPGDDLTGGWIRP